MQLIVRIDANERINRSDFREESKRECIRVRARETNPRKTNIYQRIEADTDCFWLDGVVRQLAGFREEFAYIAATYATDRRARLARSRNALIACQSSIDLFHLVEEIARLRVYREACPHTPRIHPELWETVNPTSSTLHAMLLSLFLRKSCLRND